MAQGKKSFILYCDLIHPFRHLSKEDRSDVIMWILEYTNDLEPEPLKGPLMALIEQIKQQLKRDLKSYEVAKEKKSKAGILGNLKKYNPDLHDLVSSGSMRLDEAQAIAKDRSASSAIALPAVNDTVNDTVNVNDTVPKTSLGEFENIHCEDSKLDKLREDYSDGFDWMITKLGAWLVNKNKKAKNYRSIKAYFENWVYDAYKQHRSNNPEPSAAGQRSTTMNFGKIMGND